MRTSFCILITLTIASKLLSQVYRNLSIKFDKGVGSVIDVYEKNRYELFPFLEENSFKSAQVKRKTDTTYQLDVNLRDRTTKQIILPAAEYEKLANDIKRGGDSLNKIRKRRKNFSFTRLHIYTGLGKSVTLSGNTFDSYSKIYHKGVSTSSGGFITLTVDEGDFSGHPLKEQKSNKLNFGMSINLTPRLSIGFCKLPNETKHFYGTEGTIISQTTSSLFWGSVTRKYPIGIKAEETIKSTPFSFFTEYNIFPRKQLYKMSIDLSLGLGMYICDITSSTRLEVQHSSRKFDSLTMSNYYSTTSTSAQYSSTGKIYGGMLNLKSNIKFGDFFSIFYQFTLSSGQKFNIPEQSITLNNLTAKMPQHYESLDGFGNTIGVTVHMFSGKKNTYFKKKNKPTLSL